jgi:hypothetical protein
MKGSGTEAMRRTMVWAGVVGLCVGGLHATSYLNQEWAPGGVKWGFFVQGAYNICLFLFYLILWLAPHSMLYRRPAVIGYVFFWRVFVDIFPKPSTMCSPKLCVGLRLRDSFSLATFTNLPITVALRFEGPCVCPH